MIGFAKYRRSTFATMIGVELLVAVVWLLLTRPAAPDPQPADFAALSAQPGVTASVKASGGGATFQVNLDAPEQNVGPAHLHRRLRQHCADRGDRCGCLRLHAAFFRRRWDGQQR